MAPAQLSPLGVVYLQVVGLKRVVDQAVEALVGCTFEFHILIILLGV
jgi:hypothetical protein